MTPDTTRPEATLKAHPMGPLIADLGFPCRHMHCPHPEDARFWGHDIVVFGGDVSHPVCRDCGDAMIAGCAGCAEEAASA